MKQTVLRSVVLTLIAASTLTSCMMPSGPNRPLAGAAVGGVLGALAGAAIGSSYQGSSGYGYGHSGYPRRTYVYRDQYCPPPVSYHHHSPSYYGGGSYCNPAPRCW
jgi:hypothetical protein